MAGSSFLLRVFLTDKKSGTESGTAGTESGTAGTKSGTGFDSVFRLIIARYCAIIYLGSREEVNR